MSININKRKFSKDDLIEACIQAETMARLTPYGGRWNVEKQGKYWFVVWDFCRERIGCNESNIAYSALTDVNSGVMTTAEAKAYAENNLEIIYQQLERRKLADQE